MEKEKHLQLETGSYTRVVNVIIDELVKAPLLGAELAICFFVIRKTWGFNKKSDKISLSQFQKGVRRSRPTVVKALKNLQLVNILLLVKKGNQKHGEADEYALNKYYKTWYPVKTPKLVKKMTRAGKEKLKNLVKVPLHTIETTIDNNNRAAGKKPAKDKQTTFTPLGADILRAFEVVDPKNKTYYNNKSQREACEFLIVEYGFEQVVSVIASLPKTNKTSYFPKITSPYDLKEKWVKLVDSFHQRKEVLLGKGRGVAE